ncbi:MAG: TIGR02099 family protein [Candidatus Muproteobacteria bacterium RIFCSPHIGHO2_12_FULL_60_33]|uniref:TIGR02099 family protein n=1 Tax=Candidatus Muproteobacteria bacterium RIFCSPLOWO2_01_FULL_60_18 TaxID=1817768 RepID=A0A1F6U0K4_9PROT|nr:MAG: TIGR02099 family protein [Candidatus Muproteobacteria bacterium RIFCSPLOWO2_01_FULL_60_18]OGI55500.1 MAG: TIGR02099 family protein [Candidatus Muproteobacteria bacterium RIFCSPHIGHO2_12_FULL_60_33]OGI56742.1 MAG: TIGR02099 family protein [Candidatus Muproteobacteria bacterium RIFCSPHIGHO2_02_FULL_60_13]OGI60827.1 MAG: TIGR02099 family protein [Candidatus Muproteobacteria bacterium RIFCSPHIGHO2_01_FULL_61_200]
MKKRLRQYAFHIGRVTLHVSRWTLYISAAALALLTVVFIIARFLLPMITEQKPNLELYLSQRSGHPVRIDSLHAYWDGLHPGARVQGLQVFAADGVRPAIRLSEVRLSLALLPLLWGNFEINSLVVVNPSLALERLTDGRFRISGFDPLQPVERGQDEKFVNWLFQQGRLEIENGELQWSDHRETGSAVRLGRANLSLRNDGDRHRLAFNADFPDGMCDECSIVLDVTGNPLASSEWDGDIYLRAGHINISALPLIAREKLPDNFRGRFALQLQSDWEEGRPVSVRGYAKVSDLRLPIRGWDAPLGIRAASGDLSWKAKQEGWRLDVANPLLGLSGPPWAGGHLRIVYQPDESEFQIKHIDLGDITGFVTRLKSDLTESAKSAPGSAGALLDAWLAVKPAGSADNFGLRLVGDWMSPEDYSLEADFKDGAVFPYQKYPGVRGLSGHLSLSRDTGNFRIDSSDMTLSLPRVFRNPLKAQRISGDLDWERYADYWLLNGNNLRMTGEDGRGTGKLSLQLPHDPAVSPKLKLRVDFQDGNGAHAARYYPAAHLAPATLAWMESAFVAGEITQGYLVYDGPIRDFPFDKGTGKFELRGHVRRGIYRFLPGWEPIEQAEVDVAIDGSEVTVVGGGKIGKLDATQVVVQSRASGAGHHVVRVGGKVSGALDETLNVLRDVKPEPGSARWLAYLPSGLQASGAGILSLDLTIPLSDAHPTNIQGEYRFMKNALRFAGSPVAAEAIEGSVRFTEAGLHEGNLRARFLGGDTVLAAAQREGQLVIHGQGAVTAQGLAPLVGTKIAARISGSASWTGTWQGRQETRELRAEADLRGLKVSLPAPLDRPDGLADEKLVIRTESARRDNLVLALNVGSRMNGKLALAREGESWKFAGARIGFGGAPVAVPKTRDVHVRADLATVDADQWWPLLGGGPTDVPEFLTRVSASVKALTLFDRQFGNLSFDFSRNRDAWQGTVNGAAMAGYVLFSGKDSAARFEMDLAHLVLPDKLHERSDAPVDPRRLPAVQLRSKSFEFRRKQLGELDFMAGPGESGWRIERFNLARPDMNLNASGRWEFDGKNHESQFDIEFNSPDMGKTMEAFGTPDRLAGGEVSVKSHLSWPGSPTNPQLAALSGKVDVSAKKGRFLQVKAGAGRLFGLLDLSAIGRYLTLDFTPVFGKGLLYDRIQGEVNIEKGNAYTSGFSIRGPAMQLDIGGRIGLATEDFDLALELQPKLSDTVTIATWGVLGPQVAAVVLAVQKIFKKQIAAGTRITYVVKGPWDNPVITKLVKGDVANVPEAPGKADDAAEVR